MSVEEMYQVSNADVDESLQHNKTPNGTLHKNKLPFPHKAYIIMVIEPNVDTHMVLPLQNILIVL